MLGFQYKEHLASVLHTENLEFYKSHPKEFKERFSGWDSSLIPELSDGFVNGKNLFVGLIEMLRDQARLHKPQKTVPFSKVVGITRRSLLAQVDVMCHGLVQKDTAGLNRQLDAITKSADVIMAYRYKQYAIDFKKMLDKAAGAGKKVFTHPFADYLEFQGPYVKINNWKSGPIINNYDMMLGCLDKMEAEYSAYCYITLSNSCTYRLGQDFEKYTMAVWRLLEEAYKRCGNIPTKLFKCLEGLSAGIILRHLPPSTNDHAYLDVALNGIKGASMELYEFALEYVKLSYDHIKLHGRAGMHTVMEQYGHEKLHFLPIVDIEKGLNKMYSFGTMYVPNSPEYLDRVSGAQKAEYTVNFHGSNGHLPAIVSDPNYLPEINEIWAKGIPPSFDECAKMGLKHWARIRFKKNHKFDFFPDSLDLLDDKATSPELAHYLQIFAPDAMKAYGSKRPDGIQQRRLVLKMLMTEEIDIEAMFREMESSEKIPVRFAIILLMAKEVSLRLTQESSQFSPLRCG